MNKLKAMGRQASRIAVGFFAACILICGLPAEGFEDVRVPLTVGVQIDGLSVREELLDRTKEALSELLPEYVFSFKHFPSEKLKSPSFVNEIDFLLSSSSVAAAMQHYAGFSPLASATPLFASAPEHSSASVLLVRAFDGKIKTLGDLNNARIAVPDFESTEVRIQISEELKLRRIEKNRNFSFVKVRVDSIPDLFQRFVRSTIRADALGLSALYDFSSEDLKRSGLRILEPRLNDDLSYAHTTTTYPGWILSSSYRVGKPAVQRIGAVLRSLPLAGEWRWSEPADIRPMHPMLMRSDPFYAEFRPKNLGDYLYEYREVLLVLGFLIMAVILHTLRTGYLLRKRTKELTEANEIRLETERRYHLLEKQNIVGQLSSIVAHEIRQPLAAVSNYAMALRRRFENNSLEKETLFYGLDRLVAESKRANEIVDYVQNYVRTAKKDKVWISINSWLKNEAQNYVDSVGNAKVIVLDAGEIRYLIDVNDLKLMVRNLIKNALEASPDPARHPVEVSCFRTGDGGVCIQVSDNGPALSDKAFKALSMPLNSTKIGGLGLGVSIVRLLAESYGGHLEFSRRQPSGLTATVVLSPLPVAEEK